MTLTRRALLAATALGVAALTSLPVQAAETIRLAITDVDGLENLQREFGPFEAAFEKLTGLNLEFFPVSGRTGRRRSHGRQAG
ncbi:MAG: hypothetical protein HC779_06780 [Phyllobacteriaceae bacterium]|nr:hypothetical protein [Phyllobacteriaceae bacterium]